MKFKLIGSFICGLLAPLVLIAINAFAFRLGWGAIYILSLGVFLIFCPGLWLAQDASFLLRDAIVDRFWPLDGINDFIFGSFANGMLYFASVGVIIYFYHPKAS